METVLLGQGGEHQEGVVRINHKSDFPLEVKVVRNGVAENFPDADFTLTAKTGGGFTVYKAERKAGVYSHCKRDGERLIMFFDNHGLAKGRLIVSAVINHPDADYTEDGIRQENLTTTTNIELVEDNGDALQLQLPEPRVVEKVVEKIVEKETDHYTDLQKKAAAWVERQGNTTYESYKYSDILKGVFNEGIELGELFNPSSSPFMSVSASSDDFQNIIALSRLRTEQSYNGANYVTLYNDIYAPNYDLKIKINANCAILDSIFSASAFKSITIEHNAGLAITQNTRLQDFISPGLSVPISDLLIENYRTGDYFRHTKAEKVSIKILPYDMGFGADGGWYMLASIGGSLVDTFDVGYTNPGYTSETSIDFVVEKILPDVSQDEHKPNLIFRNVVGTVNEELKQKILAKGYPSVEFYEGENKVL